MKKHSRRWHALFWPLLAIGILLVLAALAVLVPNLVITQAAKDYIVQSVEDAPHAEVAIVLGARVWVDGTPMDMLGDRLETGVRLYEQGKVDKILLSGEHYKVPYNQVDVMLKYVLERGVPERDVFTDNAGLTTYDTMYRAREVFQVESALIVTQDFHLSRAVYTARQMGLEAIGVVADLMTYRDEAPNAAREILARVNAILELHFTHPAPAELGPPLPITGDGRESRDRAVTGAPGP
jgi:SanA protein